MSVASWTNDRLYEGLKLDDHSSMEYHLHYQTNLILDLSVIECIRTIQKEWAEKILIKLDKWSSLTSMHSKKCSAISLEIVAATMTCKSV